MHAASATTPAVTAPAAVKPSPVELHVARDTAFGAPSLRNRHMYVRVRAGVYAPRAAWEALAPWERYLARVHAYALVAPGAIFAYESAAALRGLPIFGEPRDIHVFAPGRTSSRRFGDVCVHTGVDGRVVERLQGFALTSAADTAIDLMRVLPPAFGLAVGDAVISPAQGGSVARESLVTLAECQEHRRGRGRLILLLPMLDPLAESTGESVSRAVIVWSGFEPPELQVVFRSDGFSDRVDFAWRSVRGIGESDGYGKYLGETPGETVRSVMDEKKRENRLRRVCRAFDRWDMNEAMEVTPLVRRLDAMGIPRVARPRPGLLVMTNRRSSPASAPAPAPAVEKPRKG
ncbi:hypothetical protein [Microbacterium cremeum]|uniref:hypothetical protein n=1 Tax=Microbacterium cremeum TaxID=2782169 RepID=UPI0018887C51|nr:hypothetical protein [Microbacterium cremeum]